MRASKILSKVIVVMFLTSFMSMAFAGADQVNDRLTFSQASSNRYIYSNNPEYLLPEHLGPSVTGGYTISQALVANTNYDAEFSHKNYANYRLRIGVLICNTNSTAQMIRVFNNNNANSGTYYRPLGASVETTYWKASPGYQDISVPANKTVFICSTLVSHGQYAVGKVLFKPLSSNMYCKIAFVKTDDKVVNPTLDANNAISVPQVTGNGQTQTTAAYLSDARTATYDYTLETNKNKAFYINLVVPTKQAVSNLNEYENPQYYLPNSRPQLMGNYGMCYFITLKNASGKKLRITPDWTSVHANGTTYQDYAIYDGSIWKSIHISDNPGYVDLTVPSNQSFKFVLPGGNTGNVYCKFIN